MRRFSGLFSFKIVRPGRTGILLVALIYQPTIALLHRQVGWLFYGGPMLANLSETFIS